jgi:hypothetical protein
MSDETSSRPVLPVSRVALQDSTDGSISSNSGTIAQGGKAEVHDRTGLYIAILALLAAGMGLGFEISRALSTSEARAFQAQADADRQRLLDQAIDARIQAGAAAAIAKANAAEVNARVALDKVQNVKVELAKRGITIKDD